MFNVIIKYSQQVTEDSWERRARSVNMDIPELEKLLSEYSGLDNARVFDIQPVNSDIVEDQQKQPLTGDKSKPADICPWCGSKLWKSLEGTMYCENKGCNYSV